jgi:nucleotide-binding universal stress UspA family protein
MTYSTVMVGLSVDQPNQARLEIAAQLAERFGTRIIGVSAAEFSPPLYFTSGEQAEKLVDESRAAIKNSVAGLEDEFRAAMEGRVTEVEWRCAEDFPARYIIQEARAADIVVVGEGSRSTIGDSFVQINPGDLVMQASRPLLVVPDTCCWLDLRSAVIAWKDTAEARRAAADALPMLRKATDVTVVEIIEGPASRTAALSRVKDVVTWLSRHGVSAAGRVSDACGETGLQLETIASELGAGVVVAGAYGHSRLREWILGGVTQRLIRPLNRCALLSR